MILCQHCCKSPANAPRELCRACWIVLAIRVRYAVRPRQREDGYPIPKNGGVMPEPTDVLPGPDKVAILEERMRRGEKLHHPLDRRHEGDLPPHWLLTFIKAEERGHAAG